MTLPVALDNNGGKERATHSATVLHHREGETAVALSPQLHIVGAGKHHSLIQAAALSIHVGNAVPAVVGDVLASLVGQQAHEGQLGGHALRADGLVIVGELWKKKIIGICSEVLKTRRWVWTLCSNSPQFRH